MLKLTLLRHAKSSWAYPELDDFLRPLNRRGYRQGQRLAEGFPTDVDAIWCSPAVRAYTTAKCILRDRPELGDKLVLTSSIYEASAEQLIQILKGGGTLKHIALLGHNPALEVLACYLTDSSVNLKTAHNILLNLNIDDWAQVSAGCAEPVSIWRPEE
ncbi:histidine phosphatase family protein [Vibrio hannami]|uniref:SixA phosphatase family protein n=1 Tax=Vibrio hannami TaxID=2717094 RepID=UPI00240FB553|nr:histidine phosphatase family protein [Vibrio hannami]MDG3086081.1 histidine phosphatase family protein [Vibrio hannami]